MAQPWNHFDRNSYGVSGVSGSKLMWIPHVTCHDSSVSILVDPPIRQGAQWQLAVRLLMLLETGRRCLRPWIFFRSTDGGLHQGLEPGVITYNATISACQKSDRWQEVGAINGGFPWLYPNSWMVMDGLWNGKSYLNGLKCHENWPSSILGNLSTGFELCLHFI